VKADLNGDTDTSDAGETARGDTAGWQDQVVRAACETLSLPFEKCAAVSGTVVASTADSLDLTGSLGASNLGVALDDTRCYYVEVLSGAYEGHRFDIDAASSLANNAMIFTASDNNTMTTVPALTGARVAIREYKLLAEQFPVASYQAGSSVSNSDYILVFEMGQWVTYYLMDVAGTPRWVKAGSGVADQGNTCMAPCLGMFVHRRGSDLSQTQIGFVRETKFACPLPAGCSLISNPYPVAASVMDRGMVNPSTASATPFTGATSVTRADQVLLWGGDATLGATNYDVNFYARTTTRNHYTTAGNSSLPDMNNTLLFQPLRSQCLCLQAEHADYVMPLPWIP
jgi:hypothetical protein